MLTDSESIMALINRLKIYNIFVYAIFAVELYINFVKLCNYLPSIIFNYLTMN